MFYEEIIINEGDEINEGIIKQIALRTYTQQTSKDEPAKYKMMFANYEIHFGKDGITMYLDVGFGKILCHSIKPSTSKENIVMTGISHDHSYFTLSSNVLSHRSTDAELSWDLEFEQESKHIKVSNLDLPLFDLRFYSANTLKNNEIRDDNHYVEQIALQPLIKNEFEQADGMRIIQNSYNRLNIRSEHFSKIRNSAVRLQKPCKHCTKK